MKKQILIVLLLLSSYSDSAIFAQSNELKITPVLKTDFSSDSALEASIMQAELMPGGSTGRHFHAGDEYATVLEGEVEVSTEGAGVKLYKAGEAYHNKRGVVHETRNPGTKKAKISAVFITDKGQPIVIKVH